MKIDTKLNLESHFAAATTEAWKKEAEAQLRGAPWEKVLQTRTLEGISLDPIYHPQPIGACLGGKREPWTILQPVHATSPQQHSVAINRSLHDGQNGVLIELDDSSIQTAEDLATALDGVLLDAVPLFLRTRVNGGAVATVLKDLCARISIPPSSLSGGLLFDPIGESASAGSMPDNLAAIIGAAASVAKVFATSSPGFRTLSVNSSRYAEAGANAVDELAIALATGAEYMRSLGSAGVSATDAATALTVEVALGPNFFMEVAKLRALRILWQGMVEAFGAEGDAAKPLMVGKSTRFNKSSLDAPTNILRSTTEALAGALGGCSAIELLPFEGGSEPSARALRLARNTQIILQRECPLLQVEDPTAGSWFVETLTRELCEKAWAGFQQIEANGGVLLALQSGSLQQSIAKTAAERLKQVAQRRTVLVGVNRFADSTQPNATAVPGPLFAAVASPGSAKQAAAKLEEFLSESGRSLPAGESFASGTAAFGLLPVGGKLIEALAPLRLAEPYEQLRAAVGELPIEDQQLMILHGLLPKEHILRAEFTTEYFAAGGFTPVDRVALEPDSDPLGDLVPADARIVVLCADDAIYPNWVPAACKALKQSNPNATILLAGDPGKNAEAFAAAGLDGSFTIRSNHLEVLQGCLATVTSTRR